MLYVSTRNPADHHTAHRAVVEPYAPDGGFFVPYRLPVLTKEECFTLLTGAPTDAISKILDLLFGLHLNGWDVECAIGRSPIKPETIGQRIHCAEAWRNPAGCWDYLVANLYDLITDGQSGGSMPEGWALIAIQMSLLFGACASMDSIPAGGLDIAVAAGDFSDVVTVGYAKDIGLPVNKILFSCNENSTAWEFVNRGVFNTAASVIETAIRELDLPRPRYLEMFIFQTLGAEEVCKYLSCCSAHGSYTIQREQIDKLHECYYGAVVSADRAKSIQGSLLQANRYSADIYTALACGGLLNYRSRTGLSKDTLILAKQRPSQAKE